MRLNPWILWGQRLETNYFQLNLLQTTFFRRWLRGQTFVNLVAKPHQLRQAGHRDEDDGGGVWPEGGDQGARADRVLGQQDHLLHRPPLLPQSFLLDLQVRDISQEPASQHLQRLTILDKKNNSLKDFSGFLQIFWILKN